MVHSNNISLQWWNHSAKFEFSLLDRHILRSAEDMLGLSSGVQLVEVKHEHVKTKITEIPNRILKDM